MRMIQPTDLVIQHTRRPSTGGATVGDLFIEIPDGVEHQCVTLEDENREPPTRPILNDPATAFSNLCAWVLLWKIQDKTAIPAGVYEATIDFSQRFQKRMIHILDVPGFTGIRAHAGENVEQTDGCVLTAEDVLQTAHGVETVGSASARDALFAKIDAALTAGHRVWWKVSNAP